MKYTFVFFKSKLIKLSVLLIYIFLILYLIIFSKQTYLLSKEVVEFWMSVLIPSLLPFLLISDLIITTNVSNYFNKIFGFIISKIFKVPKKSSICIILGFICGYPNGAKSVISLYEEKQISHNTAKKLLAFTNNCNPVFLISSVGIAIFSDIYAGIVLLLANYISALLIGLFFPCNNIIHEKSIKVNKNEKKFNIKQSILKSFNTLILILGFSIIFNIIASIISNITSNLIKNTATYNIVNSIIYGMFEISHGILKVSKLEIPYIYKMCVTSFICSFSSFSIIFQLYTVISKNFKLKHILIYKFIQGILSILITYILISNFIIFQSPYI